MNLTDLDNGCVKFSWGNIDIVCLTRRFQMCLTLGEDCDLVESKLCPNMRCYKLNQKKNWIPIPCINLFELTIIQIMPLVRIELLLNKQNGDRLNEAFKDKNYKSLFKIASKHNKRSPKIAHLKNLSTNKVQRLSEGHKLVESLMGDINKSLHAPEEFQSKTFTLSQHQCHSVRRHNNTNGWTLFEAPCASHNLRPCQANIA